MAEKKITKQGIVIESLPNAYFKVLLEEEKKEIIAHISGKMRLHYIKVIIGDKVLVELSSDGSRGRIIRRL